MTEDQLASLFERRLTEVRQACGPMTICLMEAGNDLFPMRRSYAFFSVSCKPYLIAPPGTSVIAFAEKYKNAPLSRIEAVLMHEFGHAMDFLAHRYPTLPSDRASDPAVHRQGTERRADALAEGLWGVKIKYDDDTVQSLCCGVRPRPSALGL
jgi:hypothetical protein